MAKHELRVGSPAAAIRSSGDAGKSQEHIEIEEDVLAQELEQIKGYLGPFMERLGTLSEDYETEKASLERAMFATLSDKSFAATRAIVEEDFNKRALVNIVKENEQGVHAVVVEGLQARRNAEKRFASKLLETSSSEFQNVVTAMREEDRKKLAYQRAENKHNLDSCRTAMNMEKCAELLRQKAENDVQTKKTIEHLKDDFQAQKAEMLKRVDVAEQDKQLAIEQKQKAELELKYQSNRFTLRIDVLETDVKQANEENSDLMKENHEKARKIDALTEELSEARQDFQDLESSKNAEIKDLRKKINQEVDNARRREAKLLERVDVFKKEAMAAKSELLTAQSEAKKMQTQRDAAMQELSEVKAALDSEREFWEAELSEKLQEIEELRGKLQTAATKMAELATQVAELELTGQTLKEQLDKVTERFTATTRELDDAGLRFTNTKNDVCTWIMDAHAGKNCVAPDLEQKGEDEDLVAKMRENVTRAKHFDLLLLFRIIDGEFAGLYPMSDERAHVAEFLLTGELPDDHVKTGDEDEKSSIQNEKEGSVASGGGHVTRVPVMQQLSEATRRVQQLEEELAVIEERWSNEYKTNQAEWRSKCISLAQRLQHTEAEIPKPRTQDVEQIKNLEAQVRCLYSALNAAAKEKLLQDPNWRPPPLPRIDKFLDRPDSSASYQSRTAKESLLAQSSGWGSRPSSRGGTGGLGRTAPPLRSRSKRTSSSSPVRSRTQVPAKKAPERARTPVTKTGDSLARMPSRPQHAVI